MDTYFKIGIFILFNLMIATAFADSETNESATLVKWGYVGNIGPEKWGQLDPSFSLCASGKSQSPINISNRIKKRNKFLQIQYQPEPMVIVRDGETALLIKDTKTIIADGHSVQVNFPPDHSNDIVRYENKKYSLLQFHFHTPSETTVRGVVYPMEIHFVHQGPDGEVLVIAVLVNAGFANPTLQKIIHHLPKIEGKEIEVKGENMMAKRLLPAKTTFYHFMGSLTTPPCTEGLQWLVMAEPISASPAQIMEIRRASHGVNARPIQALYGRKIYYSLNK